MDTYNSEDIVRFINGQMNDAEAAAFEQELRLSAPLAEEVTAQRRLSRLVQIASIKQQLDNIQQEYGAEPAGETNSTPVRRLNKTGMIWGWTAAAAAMAGIAIFLFLYRQGSSPNEAIFAAHFRDDAGLPSLMGNTATPFDEAMVYYKSGEYKTAGNKFDDLLSHDPGNNMVKYYEALCRVRLEDETGAIKLLRSVSAPAGSELDIKAKWYTALVLIHQKKSNQAVSILEGIKDTGSFYSKESAALLEELKNEHPY